MSAVARVQPLKLSPPVKAVALVLALLSDAQGGPVTPSVPELQGWTCLSRTAVLESLSQLEGAGHIARQRSAGKRTGYAITVREATQQPREPVALPTRARRAPVRPMAPAKGVH